jgi:hypothetical protein
MAMPHRFRLIVGIGAAAATMLLATRVGDAHKPITSKYTYNDDVFAILRDKCSRCHIEGGVAPMSLMTYEEAFPWAESIRAELIASHMPPWNAEDGFGAFKHAMRLTPKELDVVLTWATGGNPRGQLDQQVPKVALKNDWIIGLPDVKIVLPEYEIAADKMDDTHEFTIASGVKDARWVRAADLLPGTPSVVRSAVIAVKGAADSAFGPEQVLGRWLPGQEPESIDRDGAAYRLPANAEITVRVHYKKNWQFEGKPLKDMSTIGLYFTPEKTAQELLVLPVAAPANAAPADQKLTFSQTIEHDVAALAVSPIQVPPNITLQAEAILPNGTRAPIIRLNTRADWSRRYWFEKPIAMPRGTKIEIVANLEDPDLLSAAFSVAGSAKPAPRPLPMRLSLNVVPTQSKPSAP